MNVNSRIDWTPYHPDDYLDARRSHWVDAELSGLVRFNKVSASVDVRSDQNEILDAVVRGYRR